MTYTDDCPAAPDDSLSIGRVDLRLQLLERALAAGDAPKIRSAHAALRFLMADPSLRAIWKAAPERLRQCNQALCDADRQLSGDRGDARSANLRNRQAA